MIHCKPDMIHHFLLQRMQFGVFWLVFALFIVSHVLSPKGANNSLLQMTAFWEVGRLLKNVKAF